MLFWIPFRAVDLSQTGEIFQGLFRDFSLKYWVDGSLTKLGLGSYNLLFSIVAIVIVFLFDYYCDRKGCELYSALDHTRGWLRFGFYYLLIIMILFSANAGVPVSELLSLRKTKTTTDQCKDHWQWKTDNRKLIR